MLLNLLSSPCSTRSAIMYIFSASIIATFTSLSFLQVTSAANIGRSDVAQIEARDNVAACKAVLVALKASAFCSSFVPIKDVTSTVTKSGPAGSTQVTVTAPCTNAVYFSKMKRTAPSTTPSTTPGAPSASCRSNPHMLELC
jgi:hypothetical protein